MRIGHVTDFYLPQLGGIEMHGHDLATRQRAAGHEVEVITSTGWADWPVQWTAVSDVAADAVRVLVGPDRSVLVLPNGIDPAQWRIRPAPRNLDQVLVTGVMRLAARKRPLPLLRMLRPARTRLAGDPAERDRLAAGSRLSPPRLSWSAVLSQTAAAYAAAERLARPATRPVLLDAAG